MIPNDDWFRSPESVKQAWRQWKRGRKGLPDLESEAFAAGWALRWLDDETRREMLRLKRGNARLREQVARLEGKS